MNTMQNNGATPPAGRQPPAQARRACPHCGTRQARLLDAYSPPPWEIVSCSDCQFVYLRNPVAYEDLREEFAWERTYAAKKASSRGSTVFSPVARRIRNGLNMYRDRSRHFRRWFRGEHVLDIGCGDTPRIPPPMIPYGIEISSHLHRRADAAMRARGGYCLHGPGAEAIREFPPDSFDGVIMNSYLEHETRPLDVLRGVWRVLRPTGAAFVRVPNFGSLNRRVIGRDWCGFRHPDHVNYFTLRSLRALAGRAGFDTRLVNRFTLPIDDNITVLLRKSQS